MIYGGGPREHLLQRSAEATVCALDDLIRVPQMKLPHTIAVVDDDDFVRSAMESLVRSLGMRVATFSSAEAFLQSPCLDEADCLITDLQMPGISGLELQQRLLAQGRHMPVIILTAFPDERLRLQAERAGAVGFFAKPCDGQAMVDCLDAALRRATADRPKPPASPPPTSST
jgi:FixJ family two-component response regulator